MEIFFLRDDDIPDYVADGVADIGIIGENLLAEHPKDVEVVEKLGFGKCRLSIAVPSPGRQSSCARGRNPPARAIAIPIQGSTRMGAP